MGIGICFLLFIVEKIHSRFFEWKNGGASPKVSSASPNNNDDSDDDNDGDDDDDGERVNGVVFSRSADVAAIASSTGDASLTRGVAGKEKSVHSISALTSAPSVAARKRWSWDSEEDEIYDQTQFRLHLK